jgi:hypothetical protein
MEVEAVDRHRQAAELHVYIRAGGQLHTIRAPVDVNVGSFRLSEILSIRNQN